MHFALRFIIFIICVCRSTSLIKNSILFSVADRILELNASQICFVRSEEIIISPTKFNLVFKKITREIPTFIIEFDEKTKVLNKNKKIENSRVALNTDLYIVVENSQSFNVEKFSSVLSEFVEMNPLPPRAKFLIILIGDYNSFEANFKKLLVQAWSLKYLDLTILVVNNNEDLIVLNYNPFFKVFNINNISLTQLFPDKIKNMNGYKIKTILQNKPPHVEFSNISNQIIVNGMNFGFLKLTSAALNFAFDYVEINTKSIFSEKYFFEKIGNGKIDTLITLHILGTQLANAHNLGILTGKVVREAEMNLIAPIFLYTQEANKTIYFQIIVYSCVLVLTIVFTMIILKLSKIDLSMWTPFYIFALLFGVTVSKKPHKWTEKLIYVSLAIISIKYSSDMFAVFSDNDVITNKEIIFNAFEEVADPSLPIYMQKTFFQTSVEHDDEVIYNLQSHAIRINSTEECYKKLASQKDRFCFSATGPGKYRIKQYSNPDKSLKMKIIYPTILSDFHVAIYGKGSPFIKKFDKKFQQILEAGLQDSIPGAKKYFEPHKARNLDLQFHPIKNINNQLVILTIGSAISALIFVFELLKEKSFRFLVLRAN